jgi:DNA-binding transcriptional LysR family regulator
VGRLERELGVELLSRSTRRIAVTEAGERVLAWGRRALAEAAARHRARRRRGPYHPLARAKHVPVECLADQPLITSSSDPALRDTLLALAPAARVVAEADALPTVWDLTARGLGVALQCTASGNRRVRHCPGARVMALSSAFIVEWTSSTLEESGGAQRDGVGAGTSVGRRWGLAAADRGEIWDQPADRAPVGRG